MIWRISSFRKKSLSLRDTFASSYDLAPIFVLFVQALFMPVYERVSARTPEINFNYDYLYLIISMNYSVDDFINARKAFF